VRTLVLRNVLDEFMTMVPDLEKLVLQNDASAVQQSARLVHGHATSPLRHPQDYSDIDPVYSLLPYLPICRIVT
jgi:hypothetical protein